MAHDVFISHSSNNRTVANAACAALESIGIRCWIAPRDVLPGRSYSGEITRAIQQSRAFVLIFSQHSNNSEQVLREVQLAANSHLHIVQFRIDAVSPSDDLEYYLSGPHWLDAVTPTLDAHLEQLKSSMKALLALPAAGSADKASPPAPPIAPISRPPPARTKCSSRSTACGGRDTIAHSLEMGRTRCRRRRVSRRHAVALTVGILLHLRHRFFVAKFNPGRSKSDPNPQLERIPQ